MTDTHDKHTKASETRGRGSRHHLLASLLMLLSATAFAGDNVTRNIIELSTGVGYYNFDNDRNADDTAMVGVGLGLHFSPRWLMLLNYSALDYDSARPKIVIQKYHVDAYRFFNAENALRPYIVAGFGQLDFEDGNIDSTENMLNTGVGISYQMTPSWFVRTDARVFFDTDNSDRDSALTLTLGYRLNLTPN